MTRSIFDKGYFPGARLVFCERFNERSTIWNLTRHEHPFIELMYFLDGGAHIHGDSDDLILSVYDVVIYPERYFHKEDVDLSHHQEVVCLGIQLREPSGLDRIWRLSDTYSQLRWLFIEIHAQSCNSYAGKYVLLDHLVQALFHYLKQYMDARSDIKDPISRVIHYINENLARHITVEDLAELANYSPSYLDRQFKARTGLTPIKYLNEVRLAAASRLLSRRDRDMTVSCVSNLIGFDDPRYFSRCFTARFGVSPSEYRKKHVIH